MPIIGVPETLRQGLAPYRPLFCREEGFEHVSRYVTGLILSPHKTRQGIYEVQGWGADDKPRRRALHAAVCEAGWAADALLPLHRQVVAPAHRGRGREVLSLDWTYAHQERGPKIWGVKKAGDHVEQRLVPYQTVVTGVIAQRECLDGLEVVVQHPARHEEEWASLQETVRERYEQLDVARTRGLELWHHRRHRWAYQKRTARALEMVRQREHAGHFPQAPYAVDHGLLTVELPHCIESVGTHWVSDVECARQSQWQGHWQRVEAVAAELRRDHPASCRPVRVRCRHGDTTQYGAFTKVVRRKRSGRKRLVIVHADAELSDAPRFVLTAAHHGESGRVLETWSSRGASDILHACAKPVTGVEAAQVRKEEAVKRHFRLSCVAPSLLQPAPASGATSERLAFAKGEKTCGQRCDTIVREAWSGLLRFVASLLARGRKCDDILELLLPA